MSRAENKYPASEMEVALFGLVGEAVCKIQFLEDAINHAIVIKDSKATEREIADKMLFRNRKKNTLGDALKIIEARRIFSETLKDALESLKNERNWLIHQSISSHVGELNTEQGCLDLFSRLKAISKKAQTLQHSVEADMIEYCCSKGMDTTNLYRNLVDFYGEDSVEELFGLKKPN